MLTFTGPADMGKPLETIQMSEGLSRMARPELLAHLTHGREVVVVNFSTPETLQLLKMAQIGGVPCNNPNCTGGVDGWDTEPVRWQTDTTAPLVYIDKDGNRLC